MGDVIHALPAAAALRNMSGVERLDWVINQELAPLLDGNPCINRVIRFPRRALHAIPQFLHDLRREYYHLAVDLQGLLRSAWICKAARTRKIIGFADAREGATLFYSKKLSVPPGHALWRNMEAMRQLGASTHTLSFPLPRPALPPGFAVNPPYIALHPFSKWPTKRLDAETAQHIIDVLQPHRVVIIGRGTLQKIAGAEDWSNRTSLSELLAMVQHARAVISTDSGPLHIACACDIPTLGLYGPTDPTKTGPWTVRSQVVQRALPCVPCLNRSCRWREPHACLRQLPVEDILEKLLRLLQQEGAVHPASSSSDAN